ncbi:imidazoleglycerol-phosphate dehydratase HisB [Caldinitratiruptor microaerophilus]|uniref:Imidazoleglycerol-phosphate dehydratase n=1 Tax=Caldinitratiruptor microaerophilus TaxID=671077 RepID=A0AA35CML8_9FIRM|nr:imidazoleglycerol-phosphate dehydratase HisB [Caldinitratiruptor microaerophilus]BDG61269.1 imidazoleglycerol-phosphate dehydratase [Caldinitratiruptor microaerophilus]
MAGRSAEVSRQTAETKVRLALDLDGSGRCRVRTGIGFFDHMLVQIARHGLVDLEVDVDGDLHVDPHHTVEDTGLALGTALRQALGDGRGIRRYGEATVPMDEALARAVVDLSGRPFLVFQASFPRERVGEMDTELVREFFQAVAARAGMTLHLRVEYGENAHHMVEALFKAFARALDAATALDPRVRDVPSSKGSLL